MESSELIRLYLNILEQEQKLHSPKDWYKTFLANKHRFFPGTEGLLELLRGSPVSKKHDPKLISVKHSLSFLVKFGYELFIIKKNERKNLAALKKVEKINLVKTFSYDHSFKSSIFVDNLLGDLHLYLKEKGRNVVIVHEHLGKFETSKSKHITNALMINLYAFISWRDYFSQYFALFKNLLGKLPGASDPVANFIRTNFNSEKVSPQFYMHELHYCAFKNMIKFHDLEKIYSTFENNSWEKMLIFARNDLNSKAPIISHQHVPIAPCALNYYLIKSELKLLPDRIVTMGKIINDLFIERFYPKDVLRAGCPLRLKLAQHPLSPNADRLALIALDGIPQAAIVLNTILKNIELFKKLKWKFVVRFHQVMGYELMQPYLIDRLEKHDIFELSSKTTLVEDIKRTNCVFYWGSSVAFEAMYSGRVVIHTPGDEILSNDPIGLDGGLHFVARNLEATMILVSSLTEAELKERSLQSIRYCQEYFGELNAENLKNFD